MDISKLFCINSENRRIPINALSTKHMYNILKLYRKKRMKFTESVKAIEHIYNHRKKIITMYHVSNCNTICGKVAINHYKFPWV